MSKLRLIKPKTCTIEIDGKDYELSLNMSAFASIEERYGSVEKAFSLVEQSNVTALLYCFWTCLNEAIPEKEFYSYVGISNLKKIADMFAELVNSAMPEDLEVGKTAKK